MDTYKKKVLIALQLLSVALLLLASATSALAQTGTTASTQPPATGPATLRNIILPPMPDNLQVGDGFTAFRVGHAVGTQNYVCKPTGNGGFAFAPDGLLLAGTQRGLAAWPWREVFGVE